MKQFYEIGAGEGKRTLVSIKLLDFKKCFAFDCVNPNT